MEGVGGPYKANENKQGGGEGQVSLYVRSVKKTAQFSNSKQSSFW